MNCLSTFRNPNYSSVALPNIPREHRKKSLFFRAEKAIACDDLLDQESELLALRFGEAVSKPIE
jgi:hypothetical protein